MSDDICKESQRGWTHSVLQCWQVLPSELSELHRLTCVCQSIYLKDVYILSITSITRHLHIDIRLLIYQLNSQPYGYQSRNTTLKVIIWLWKYSIILKGTWLLWKYPITLKVIRLLWKYSFTMKVIRLLGITDYFVGIRLLWK